MFTSMVMLSRRSSPQKAARSEPARALRGQDPIGEKTDGTPLNPKEPEREKNPEAVKLSKLGASKVGLARAASLSDQRLMLPNRTRHP